MKTWQTRNGTTITRILFGRCNVFLLTAGNSRLLVDTGMKGDGRRLLKRLDQAGRPDTVIMTHTHFDHAGNAGLLDQWFTPHFIVHETEKAFLESGDSPIPKGNAGWTRLLYRLGPYRVPHWFHVQGVTAAVSFSVKYDLKSMGFDGYIIHTPGHSSGSCCIILEDEVAVVGDTIGGLPGAIFPPWADDGAEIIRSWEKLLQTGCNTFHPAHGFTVTRKSLEKEYRKFSHL
jgi:hydroxyacylglutathione hydrolase